MIAAVVLGLALVSSEVGPGRPQLLGANAACRLIKGGELPRGAAYSIAGRYRRGMHWSSVQFPGCDETVAATIVFGSEAAAKTSAWHRAYSEKCGVQFMDDDFSGVFTGKFIRRKVVAPLVGPPPVMTNIFVISDMESDGLAPASITCPK